MRKAQDDGIVVDVAEHFEEVVSVRIAELAQSVDKLGSELQAEISDVKVGLGRVERRLDRHEELLGEVLKEVRALKPK